MTLTDVLIIVLVLAIAVAAIYYIRKEKKKGRCIGCPYAKECAAKKQVRVAAVRRNKTENR